MRRPKITIPIQRTENQRLENLYKYEIVSTPLEGYFYEITSVAVKIFNVPIAIITQVDTDSIG